MGLGLLQMAPSEDRDLGSDLLGLTGPPGPRHGELRGFLAKIGPTRSGLKTDPGEDQAGPLTLTTVVRLVQHARCRQVPSPNQSHHVRPENRLW